MVGVSQETSAEQAIAALQEYSANEAKVLRDGVVQRVKAEELVPGDIVSIAVGDRVPADCRILSIQSNSFRVDQALLTGESESVSKETHAIKVAKAVKQDQVNMLFSGTTVATGHATAVVVLTGASTAIGDIHESITSQISQPTPLKQKLNDFGDMLAKVITVICVVVWLINIQHFNDPSHGRLGQRCHLLPEDCRITRSGCHSGGTGRGHHHLLGSRDAKDGGQECSRKITAIGGNARKAAVSFARTRPAH